MRHRAAILLAMVSAFFVVTAAWLLMTGPLAHVFDTVVETWYAIFTILIVCMSIVVGIIVGVWDATREVPRQRRHIHFSVLRHHH